MRYVALAGLIFVLAGCAGGGGGSGSAANSCESAGHKPGSAGYSACTSKMEADQAAATRKIANQTPITGYGPIGGRF